MDIFLTLVTPPAHENTLRQVVADLEGILTGAKTIWLSDGVAVDLVLPPADIAELEKIVQTRIAEQPIDFLCGPVTGRRKKLLIADMDSTFVTSETLDDMAAHVGLKDEITAITARSMRGELDFEASVRERVKMIAGMSVSAVLETLSKVELTSGAQELARTMRHHGAYTALVSGGFTLFTEKIYRWCNFHEHRSNVLGISDGKLTGDIDGAIVGREAKREALDELCGRHGLGRGDALTIGDGANDLDMIEAAGLGIAYYGKPMLADAARANIRHTDLKTALYYQGYDDTEIVMI